MILYYIFYTDLFWLQWDLIFDPKKMSIGALSRALKRLFKIFRRGRGEPFLSRLKQRCWIIIQKIYKET